MGDSEAADEEKLAPALWNPNATANWSFFFSPVLGAYLQMRNWEAVGKRAEAEKARGWLIASCIFVAAIAWIATLVARGSASAGWLGLPYAYLCLWYFATAKNQADYVRTTLSNHYVHRPWFGVLTVALLLSIVFQIVISAVIMSSSFPAQPSATSSDSALKNASSRQDVGVDSAAASDQSPTSLVASDKPKEQSVVSQGANPFADPNFGKTATDTSTDPYAGKDVETRPPEGRKEFRGNLDQPIVVYRLLCKYERDDGSIVERLHTVDETRRTVDGFAVAILDDEKIVYDLPKIDGIRNIVIIDRSTGYLTVTHLSASSGPQPVVLKATCAKVPMKAF